MKLSIYKHSSGTDVLYATHQKEDNRLTLCAVSYNHEGENVEQVDCGDLSTKKLRKVIKKLEKQLAKMESKK